MPPKPTRVPLMTTDAQAEAFLEQDLSALDVPQFVPLNRDLFARDARITPRLPPPSWPR